MFRPRNFPIILIAIVLPALADVSGAATTSKPDIVVIMADDMGYSDLGCYGGEIPTPVLDGLAADGVRFTRFFNTSRCCPTRASLLTGQYSHQSGIGLMVDDSGLPGYRGRLGNNCVTQAEVLRGAGYQTFMTGKWHVTLNPYSKDKSLMDPDTWPLQRGFDRFHGTLAGGGNYFRPIALADDNELLDSPKEDGYYYTDAISDKAAGYIRGAESGKPLFLYLAYTAPHWPLHAPEEEIKKHIKTYRAGWDEIRRQRHQRMIRLGVIDPECPLSARHNKVPPWDEEKHKEWQIRRMATHAAMVSIMDRAIGRVMDALRDTGRFDNTLVLFLSDNGASSEVIQGKNGRHGAFARGGTSPDIMPGPADTYASFGPEWANVSNTPFRLFKTNTHEGGTATPLIIHWPGGIKERGLLRHEPGHVIDLMPTIIEASAARYPEKRKDVAVLPLPGRSLLPAARGERLPDRPLFFEHMGNRAVRMGHWTLVANHRSGWELYDTSVDRTETRDVAAQMQEKVDELKTLYHEWASKSNVAPWPLKPRS